MIQAMAEMTKQVKKIEVRDKLKKKKKLQWLQHSQKEKKIKNESVHFPDQGVCLVNVWSQCFGSATG